MAEIFYLKKGDRLPKIKSTGLLDGDGNPVNLTGVTVKFVMRSRAGGVLKVNTAAAVTNAATAEVEYEWAAADTDTAGTFDAQWVASFADRDYSFPNDSYIEVRITDR